MASIPKLIVQPRIIINSQGEPVTITLEERFTFVPPGGESWQQMEQQLMGCVEDWWGLSESVAVVAHGGLLRALIPLLLHDPRESSFHYDLENASVSVFEVGAKGFQVEDLNNVGHP